MSESAKSNWLQYFDSRRLHKWLWHSIKMIKVDQSPSYKKLTAKRGKERKRKICTLRQMRQTYETSNEVAPHTHTQTAARVQ